MILESTRTGKSLVPALALLAAILAGCGLSQTSSSSPATTAVETTTTTTTTPDTTTTTACTSTVDVASWSAQRLASQMIAISSTMGGLANIDQAVGEGVGGVVLMGSGASPGLKAGLSNLKLLAPVGVAPIVMADEEGGGIQVLANLVGPMPWPRSMAQTMSPAAVEVMTKKIGTAMRSLGVTMDLAPVLGLDSGPGPSKVNPDGMRSFSVNPAITTEYARAFEAGLEEAGVTPVLKHFPGLGGSSGNTDFMAAHTMNYSSLLEGGLIPFENLAPSSEVVMVSNAVVPGLTNGVPASLSQAAVAAIRQVMKFNGLIISDSLETVSISSYQPNLAKAVVDAAKAGVDMVMLASTNPNQGPIFESAWAALTEAIRNGVISRAQAEASVGRILFVKGYRPSCIDY